MCRLARFYTRECLVAHVCCLHSERRGSIPLLPSITNFNSINMNYTLVLWPESQTYMDEPWFDDHAVLADYDSIGESQAYFIPTEYIKQ